MRKSLGGIAIASLLLSFAPLNAHAAPPQPGSPCPKSNQTQIFKGVKYSCVKSGKKLVWNKGAVIARPAAAPIVPSSAQPTQAAQPTQPPTPVVTKPALAYPFPNKYWQVVGGSCAPTGPQLPQTIGYTEKFEIAFLFCTTQGKWAEDKGSGNWDQETGLNSTPRSDDYLRQYDYFVPAEWVKNQAAQFVTGNNSARPPYG